MGVDTAFVPRMNQRCGLKKYTSILQARIISVTEQEAGFIWNIEATRQTISNNFNGWGIVY